jgi:hypothetical protein
MNDCVIMQNLIIEMERANPKAADMTFESQEPLAEVDHEVSAEFGAFIAMHQDIRDEQVHVNLHDDPVEQLRVRKEKAA